jgi:adenylate cyclase class 2
MSVEIEAKLKVESLDPVRERLKAAGAEFVRAVTERNLHYDSADGRLRAGDSVLRIRSVVVHRGAEAPSTLTYKGARLPGKVKRRTEIELEIAAPEAAGRLLEALGFTLMSEIEKRRETWRLGGCHVELDEVPYLGTFIEIEGPDEGAIAAVQNTLGLAHLSHIQEGYVALLLEHCRRNHLPIRRIGFA